ncbi:MAG: ABC transporter ATP-binding protein [Anaerolineae bacterium]|nr:ABC transporter ATP-binding protein [Anaerolineae bacterium]
MVTAKPQPLLQLVDVNTFYGAIHILQAVNLEVYAGEMVSLLGGNACGKSTTLKTILGIVRPASGQVIFDGEVINQRPTSYRIQRGMAVVPENRRVFGSMSVYENLEMGSYLRDDGAGIKEDLDHVLTLFPKLKAMLHRHAGTLSGGEQQMLALGRALMSRPRLLLMDEPSMGLSPLLVEQTFDLIQNIHKQGTTILMVEQNANMALSVADRGYVLQTGRIVLADRAEALLNDAQMRKAYLGR